MEKKSTIKTYLSFNLGDELFAINVDRVLSILELERITKIPEAPKQILGVINHRGKVLPIIDMRIQFGLLETAITVETSIIVLDIIIDECQLNLGILVDSVREVLDIEETTMEPSPTIGTRYKAEFIEGLYQQDGHFIIVLNIDHVFNADDMISVNTVEPFIDSIHS